MKKIFFFISIIIIFFLKYNNVYANIRFDYLDVYYNISFSDYSHYDKQAFAYINDELVYCLDPKKLISLDGEYMVDLIVDIDSSLLDKINLISYYGYNYNNQIDYKYYLATQELIWTTLYPDINVSWHNTSIIDVETEKTEILNLINTSNLNLLFNQTTVDTSINKELIIQDSNLTNYKVLNNPNSNVNIINDRVYIETDNYIGLDKIIFEPINKKEMKIYTYQNYQRLFVGGSILKENFLYLNIGKGSLSLELSSDNINNNSELNNSIFNVYDEENNLVAFIQNNQKVDLPYGKYRAAESNSSPYFYLDLEEHSFEISKDNKNFNLKIDKTSVKNKVIFKVQYENTELIDLVGAKFVLTDSKDSSIELISDENGEMTIYLYPDSYVLKQIEGIKNYIFTADLSFDITPFSEENYYELKNIIYKKDLMVNVYQNPDNILINNLINFKIVNINDNYEYYFSNKENIFLEDLKAGQYYISLNYDKGIYEAKEDIYFEIEESEIDYIELNIYLDKVINKDDKVSLSEKELIVPNTGSYSSFKYNYISILVLILYAKKIFNK